MNKKQGSEQSLSCFWLPYIKNGYPKVSVFYGVDWELGFHAAIGHMPSDRPLADGTLPRRENMPPACFLIRLSSPTITYTKKKGYRLVSFLFYGVDNGTRLHFRLGRK